MNYLFVYGTLCRAAEDSKFWMLEPYCEWHGQGYCAGDIYLIEDYPGLTFGEGKVKGELYRIINEEPLFEQLDDYEGCCPRYPEPWDYSRELHSISTEAGDTIPAWLYRYTKPTEDLLKIEHGDFVRFQKEFFNNKNS